MEPPTRDTSSAPAMTKLPLGRIGRSRRSRRSRQDATHRHQHQHGEDNDPESDIDQHHTAPVSST
jgi:hypothetical protein